MSLSRAPLAIVGLVGVVLVVSASLGRPQSKVPGVPAPGEAPVRVVNEVTARVAQSGAWEVSLAAPAIVSLAPDAAVAPSVPAFLRTGRRYLIVVGNSPAAVYTIDQVDHGWVRAVGRDGVRWFNLAQVVSLQEAS